MEAPTESEGLPPLVELVDDVLRLLAELVDPVALFNLALISNFFYSRLRYRSIKVRTNEYLRICGKNLAIHVAEWAARERILSLETLNPLLCGIAMSHDLEAIKTSFVCPDSFFRLFPILHARSNIDLKLSLEDNQLRATRLSIASASVGNLEAVQFFSTHFGQSGFDSLLFCNCLAGRNFECAKWCYERTWKSWEDFVKTTGSLRVVSSFIADFDLPVITDSIETLRKLYTWEKEFRWSHLYIAAFNYEPLYYYSVRNLPLLRMLIDTEREVMRLKAYDIFVEGVRAWKADALRLMLEEFPQIRQNWSPFLIYRAIQCYSEKKSVPDLKATVAVLAEYGQPFTEQCRDIYRWKHLNKLVHVIEAHVQSYSGNLVHFVRNAILPFGAYEIYEPFLSYPIIPLQPSLNDYLAAMYKGAEGLCSLTFMEAYSSFVPAHAIKSKFETTFKEAEIAILARVKPLLDHIDWLIVHGAVMIEQCLLQLVRTIFHQSRFPNLAHIIRRPLLDFFASRAKGQGFQSHSLCWELWKNPSLDMCAWLLLYKVPMIPKFLDKVSRALKSPYQSVERKAALGLIDDLIRLWTPPSTPFL